MATKSTYTIKDINNILFQGFDFSLPEETLKIISELSLQVGSPDYVKTPVFQKRENPMKVESSLSNSSFKKGKRNKATEIVSDEDWDALRSFQPTKLEEKVGFEATIVEIQGIINKMTDKNYSDITCKIINIIDKLIEDQITHNDMIRLSSIIFEIASTNRFYSKIYADLFSRLAEKYEMIQSTFEENLKKFTTLFDSIEYVDPNVDYNKFCEINKVNEKRKSLAAFYLNLMKNSVIPNTTIMLITRNLLSQIYEFISMDNKKNEVDELAETIAILYNKEMYVDDEGEEYELIEGFTISEIIEKIANSKVKDFKSLTNKSLFKFMDLIDM
jgi:hypothetical protein